MTYAELKRTFQEHNRSGASAPLMAHIIFTEDSFEQDEPLLSRTYVLSSSNKAFRPNMGGYSIFASSLDGTDPGVRLERYMAEEGNKDGWRVQECYILEQLPYADSISRMDRTEQEDGTVSFFLDNTCIRVREIKENDCVRLAPVSGDQVACGEWFELSMDRVYGYCILIARQLKEDAQTKVVHKESNAEDSVINKVYRRD